jgi:hypothetical protein
VRRTETGAENRVLRRIFGPKNREIIGGCRKLHNEELHNWYSLPDVISGKVKENEMGRTGGTRGIGVRTGVW